MARLFAAIALDDIARSFAIELTRRLERSGTPCRFERPEKLHITIAFLGSVPGERVAAYAGALADAAASCQPFRVRLDRLGGFPARRPTLLWLGCSARDAAYAECAGRVREAFAALGSQCQANDEPHVTLCRCKQPLSVVPSVSTKPGTTLEVRELTLYESLPDGTTTRYEVRAVEPLGSRRSTRANL